MSWQSASPPWVLYLRPSHLLMPTCTILPPEGHRVGMMVSIMSSVPTCSVMANGLVGVCGRIEVIETR